MTLGVVLALVLHAGAAVGQSLMLGVAAPDAPAVVLADTGGPIRELLLQFDPDCCYELNSVYHDLLSALPPDVDVLVLCPSTDAIDEFRVRWGLLATAHGRRVRLVNAGRPVTMWARDRRIARQDLVTRQPAATFVPQIGPGYTIEQCSDVAIAPLLAYRGLLPGLIPVNLHLEGGNVVSNARHAFVGVDVIGDNLPGFTSQDDLEHALSDVLGRPSIVIADKHGEPPWCHVDMFLTPVSDDTVLLASPYAAESAIAASGEDCTRFAEETLGLPSIDDLLNKADDLDAIAATLSRRYRVVRMPAIVDPDENWMVTYNNVLMERRDGRRIVYMPIYHLPALDAKAASVWRGLGFEVRPIDVSRIYDLGGAVRCLANVLSRRPADLPAAMTAVTNPHPGLVEVLQLDDAGPMLEPPLSPVAAQAVWSFPPAGTTARPPSFERSARPAAAPRSPRPRRPAALGSGGR